MRRAVIADIHANMDAFARVLEDIDQSAVDEVICLGDSIGYGGQPEQTIATLRSRGIASVMGNHELGAVNAGRRRWFNPLAREALIKTVSMLSDDTLGFLAGLPPFLAKDNARFVHGFPPDLITTYLFAVPAAKLRLTMDRMIEPLCFVGHTHCLELIAYDGDLLGKHLLPQGLTLLDTNKRYLINIGSVGQPRDGDLRAKYVIWDNRQASIELRCVPYDNSAAAAKVLAAGMPSVFADRLLPSSG